MTLIRSVRLLSAPLAALLLLAACGGDDATASSDDTTGDLIVEAPGVRLVSPGEAADLVSSGGDDLVVLDIRTPEEFAEGHVDGATMIDFYAPDFADRLAALDRDKTYVLYCRSGNRSAQAAAMMADLSFTDVAEVEGGIVAWTAAGLPVTTG